MAHALRTVEAALPRHRRAKPVTRRPACPSERPGQGPHPSATYTPPIVNGSPKAWGGAGATVPRAGILDQARGLRVVLFGAPGGSGKTTAAEQVLEAWEMGTIRVRFASPVAMDEAVAELARGARRAGLGDLAAAMNRASDESASAAVDTFVGFANERALAFAVFLDDVHHLDAVAASELAAAMRDLPTAGRAIVAGRELGGFASLDRLPGSGLFGADELRMSDAEVAVLLGDGASASLVKEVSEATTGWCAAVSLATQRLRTDPAWSPSASGGGRVLLDSLVAEMLEQAPALGALGAATLIDADVAAIIGGPDLFDAARRAGILAAHRGRWWVIPDPIRESSRLEKPLDEAAAAEIAAHFRKHGEIHAAVDLASKTSPAVLVGLLGSMHWTELEAVGSAALVALVEGIDASLLRESPELLIAVARAIELTAPDSRQQLLSLAAQLSGERPALRKAVDAEIARDLVSAARLDDAVSLAQSVLDGISAAEPVTRARSLTTLARVSVFHCTPESLCAGAELYAEAARLFRDAEEPRWLADTLARRGYTALYMAGAPAEGEEEMRAALALLPAGDFTRGFWLTCYSDLLDYLGRVTEAEGAAHEALEIGRRRRDPSVEGMAWWSLSWVAAHRGDVAAFRAAVEAFERVAGSWVRAGQHVEFLSSTAELAAMLGDDVTYAEYFERGRSAAAAAGYLTPIELAEARYLALHGDPDAAADLLERLESGVALVPSNRPTRVILQALAEARRGNVERAAELRDDAERAAAAMGVPDLLLRYASSVMGRIREIVDGSPGSGALAGAGVTLRVLGGFSVERAGERRTPQPGHPATLVKLLALRGVITTDAALDSLWPDADLTTGRSRLRNLLNRLKQRSGELVVRDGETLRLDASVDCDLHVFEERSADAIGAPPEERVGLARHAISLYAGELLPGDAYEDWSLGPRERAKRRYLTLIDLVADDAIARGDTDEAVRLLDLGMVAEPLDESRYVRMCEVLVSQGRLGSAREVAARAVVMLDEIGARIDANLRELASG